MLIAAFENTSAQRLADTMDGAYPVIALRNSKTESVSQLFAAMDRYQPEQVICLGQKPVIRDKIYIELTGRLDGREYHTDFDCKQLAEALSQHGLDVRFSCRAGTSYCNHIYACGMKHVLENSRRERLVFIHIPFEKNISDLSAFSEKFRRGIAHFAGCREKQEP